MIWLSCKADVSSVSGLNYGRTIAATILLLQSIKVLKRTKYKQTRGYALRSALTSGVIQCIAGLVGFEPTHNRIKTDCLTIWR